MPQQVAHETGIDGGQGASVEADHHDRRKSSSLKAIDQLPVACEHLLLPLHNLFDVGRDLTEASLHLVDSWIFMPRHDGVLT